MFSHKRSIAVSVSTVFIGIIFYTLTQSVSTSSEAIPSLTPAATALTTNVVAAVDNQIVSMKRYIHHITTANADVKPANMTNAAPARATLQVNSVSIPSIGFFAPIREVGVTPDNAIDVPSGMQVGHWIGSAIPGNPGAAFLDGHLQGIFANLSKLHSGKLISVNYGGKTFQYRVVHTEVVPLAGIDMDKALSVYGASEGLNLMTCAGTYVPSQGTYDQRFVVYAIRN